MGAYEAPLTAAEHLAGALNDQAPRLSREVAEALGGELTMKLVGAIRRANQAEKVRYDRDLLARHADAVRAFEESEAKLATEIRARAKAGI